MALISLSFNLWAKELHLVVVVGKGGEMGEGVGEWVGAGECGIARGNGGWGRRWGGWGGGLLAGVGTGGGEKEGLSARGG